MKFHVNVYLTEQNISVYGNFTQNCAVKTVHITTCF